ncbi:hypothetical protein AAC387_Pa03g2748 [Persea americana]
MSDEGERTCPLCMEEMDFTDQQLKPCKCGYEICVWCWHQIMDMAEKDDTEGRCPACRTPYDKEKIVGMAASCERMVAEISSERRFKSQKIKSKTSEGTKHLSSVRVIQRNLAYVIGLPANLADEAILERKEYFGQYGKVLKVSITRSASASQHPSNTNTCSVYITYAKEEEAVRCIESVHGFVLEGRSLRACFGTTKYCHAWLRNMPCNNPDCLYLHDMGTPEDSFTKDEIISAYERSRVQQFTGAANNAQRCSGSVLPPPSDDFCNNSSTATGKIMVKSASNHPSNQVKVSHNGSLSGRSSVLPAAASWGLRASSSCQPPAASMVCSQGPSKEKTDALDSSLILSLIAANSVVTSDSCTNGVETPIGNENDPTHLNGSAKCTGSRTSADAPARVDSDRANLTDNSSTPPNDVETHMGNENDPTHLNGSAKYTGSQTSTDAPARVDSDHANLTDNSSTPLEDKDQDKGIYKPPNFSRADDLDRQQSSHHSEVAHGCRSVNEASMSLSSQLSSVDIDNHLALDHSDISQHLSPFFDKLLTRLDGNAVARQHYPEHGNDAMEPLTSLPMRNFVMVPEDSCVSRELLCWSSELQTQLLSPAGSKKDDVQLPVDDLRLELSKTATCSLYLPYPCNPLNALHVSSGFPSQHGETGNASILGTANYRAVDGGVDTLLPFGGSLLSNGYDNNKFSSYGLGGCVESDMFSNVERVRYSERFSGNSSEVDRNARVDLGESSIISDIFASDLDVGDDFAKLLGETDKQNGIKSASSWKPQNSSQSRFSFARQEDLANQATPLCNSGHVQKKYCNTQDSAENMDISQCNYKFQNGSPVNSFEVSGSLININSLVPPSPNRVAVSRAQISAPPGFSAPTRSTPPGFTSQDKIDRTFFSASPGNQLLESPSMGNQNLALLTRNIGSNFDYVEFIDPAILAVGKGTLPLATSNPGFDLASTFSSSEQSRLPLLMQQSFTSHQNSRISALTADRFSPLSDSYISSRLVEQTQGNGLSQLAQISLPQSRNSRMSNGHRDGWNGIHTGNDLVLSEIVRNERLGGFTKYFPGPEELKLHMPTSGDLYNRAFGM